MASCYGASVGDRQRLGASPGEQTRKLVRPVRALDSIDEALAEFGGINLHVGPAIDGRDRKRLERSCRYMVRSPVCQERLAVPESGQVVVRFKNAWRNGAHAVVLEPLDFNIVFGSGATAWKSGADSLDDVGWEAWVFDAANANMTDGPGLDTTWGSPNASPSGDVAGDGTVAANCDGTSYVGGRSRR